MVGRRGAVNLWLPVLVGLVLPLGCSKSLNSLSGSEGQVYDLTFDSVLIVLQGTSVSIKYVATGGGDPAILVVDTANISNVAGSSIDLTQLDSGQVRGVLENVNGADGVTNPLMITFGNVVFDQEPKVGATLSGQFNATISDGYTLNGVFSGKVHAP